MMETNQVKIGSNIHFHRKGIDVYGEVIMVRENSVIVKIDPKTAKSLEIGNSLTVVNHLRYKMIK
jgi:uncharacterized protein YkvS